MEADFIFELFKTNPRQGPGSVESTLKALSYIHLPENPRVLDLGCGTGSQTLTLAKSLSAEITAVDIHQPYLDILWHLAYHLDPPSKISTSCQSMADPDLPKNNYDLIWSEGAIYIVGFEDGLKSWNKFLRPGGHMAVTEVSWFRDDPPAEVAGFWKREYPDIRTVHENLEIIENLGYKLVGHFSIPEADWWEGFYTPLLKRTDRLKSVHVNNLEIMELLEQTTYEIDLYRKYAAYYGYEFYIMEKPIYRVKTGS